MLVKQQQQQKKPHFSLTKTIKRQSINHKIYLPSCWGIFKLLLAWRIPGTEELVGLPSMGLHRVRHDWRDLAAAATTTAYNKESACNANLGLIPGSGISLGEGNGSPLQYSCLENSMARGVWRATIQEIAESGMTERPTHTHTKDIIYLSTYRHMY